MDSIPIPHPTGLPAHADIVIGQRDVHRDDDDDNETDEEQLVDHPAPAPAPAGTENGSFELWSKQSRPRGRRARDPNAEFVRFDCKDVDDLESSLRNYLKAPTANAEHATIEFHFPVTAAFMVYTRDFKRDPSTNWTSADVTDLMRKTAVSVYEVLQETQNPKDQIVRQKAVARTVVEAVQRADKFRYSFHNNWLSREDQAHRFSFFCNDSTLNKGRAANGGAGTEGKISRKPVYDCKGLIAVKFSVTKQDLQVDYKHVPVHKSYDERAPLPRRESKRRRMLEVLDPERLKTLRQERKKKLEEERLAAGWVKGKGGRPQKPEIQFASDVLKKRRRKSEGPQTNNLDEQAIADEGLQPLLEFLGSAERTEGNDDDAVMTDRDGRLLQNRESNIESVTPPAFPRDKLGEMRNTAPRRRATRAKYHGPLLPGMMEGTMQSGSMDWNVTTPTKPHEAQTSQGSGAESISEKPKQQRQKMKSREAPEEDQDRPGKRQNREDETELEQLKRRLHETEQRLMKIEAEKSMAATPCAPPQPGPYSPYPYYPHYPYPPPQYPQYPLPPQTQPPPSAEKMPAGGPSSAPWVVYLLPPQPAQNQTQAGAPQSTPNPQASHQRTSTQSLTDQIPPAQTIAQSGLVTNPPPNQSAPTAGNHESSARGNSGQQQSRGEAALQNASPAGPLPTGNRADSIPAIQPQTVTAANVPPATPGVQSQPSIMSGTQAPTQMPPQVPSASVGNIGPPPLSYVRYSQNPTGAQATGNTSRPDSAPQQPSQPADITKTSSKKPSQQPVRGGVRLSDVRHIQPAASSGENEDPYLKGLFDNAMAAILRIDTSHNGKSASAAAPAPTPTPTEAPPANLACGPTLKVIKESWGTLPPTGALSFKLPNYKPPPRNFYKYGTDSNQNKAQASGGKTPTTPSTANGASGNDGTPVAAPHPPPYYQYPYPPYQQNYPPPPHGPPPPGYSPYPPQGYPPYPPPPGYGYPPYPAYSYPPAPAPVPAPPPTETEAQKKVREQKEKDAKEGAPAWAAQLRDAMKGYANATPGPITAGKNKATDATQESADKNKEGPIASDTANTSAKDAGPAKEKEVVQIDSDDEEDGEGSGKNPDAGPRQENRSTASESVSASPTPARDGANAGT